MSLVEPVSLQDRALLYILCQQCARVRDLEQTELSARLLQALMPDFQVRNRLCEILRLATTDKACVADTFFSMSRQNWTLFVVQLQAFESKEVCA